MEFFVYRQLSLSGCKIYLLQLPFVAGFAKYLYGFEPKKRYLLNKFSVAGFYFYEGPNILEKMKLGDTLTMKPNAENLSINSMQEGQVQDRQLFLKFQYLFN